MSKAELLTALSTEAAPIQVTGTLGDAALDLHKMISATTEKSEFFSKLTSFQRGILVAHLNTKGFRWIAISSQLGITIGQVKEYVDSYSLQLGNSIMSQSLQSIIGDLYARHAERYAMAMEGKDYKAALAMDQAWVKTMLELGVVERATQKHEITHTLDTGVKEEINKMLEIERKKRFREEQIQMLDKEVEATTELGDAES